MGTAVVPRPEISVMRVASLIPSMIIVSPMCSYVVSEADRGINFFHGGVVGVFGTSATNIPVIVL